MRLLLFRTHLLLLTSKKMERMVLEKSQEVAEEAEAEAEAEAGAGARGRIDSSKCINLYLSVVWGHSKLRSTSAESAVCWKNIEILVCGFILFKFTQILKKIIHNRHAERVPENAVQQSMKEGRSQLVVQGRVRVHL